MKKANGLLVGLIFILIGFLYACSALDLIEFSIFFDGWWTLFIILPCLYGLLKKDGDKTGYVIGLVIGACFFINAQDIDFDIDFWPLMVAILCIVIGVKLVLPSKEPKKKHIEVNYNASTGSGEVEVDGVKFDNTYKKDAGGYLNVSAVLGGKDVRVDNESFTGADICAILGAVEIDLRNAIISEDVYVRVTTIMGGIDIYVPANVRVVTDACSPIMGAVDVNTTYANHLGVDAPRLILSGTCVMGGIDIK